MSNVHQKITRLENRILELEKILRPIALEKQALHESREIITISCDASWNNGIGTCGIVIRGPNIKEPYKFTRTVGAATSNEAELDAIWSGIDTFISLFANHKYVLDQVEVRSDSKHCINLLNGKGKPRELANKITHILTAKKQLDFVWEKELIKFVWKKRNSTFDLIWADNLSKGN